MPIEFKKYVEETISRLKAYYDWSQDSDAFAHWAICHVSSLPEREVYEDVYVGSKDDKSLDGFYVDHHRERIHLFQCKQSETGANFGDRAALVDFVGVLKRLRDEKSSKEFKNLELRRCGRRYRDAIESRYHVWLNFIVGANLTLALQEEVKLQIKSLPAHQTLEVWDLKRLEKLYWDQLAFNEPISDTVSLKLIGMEHLAMSPPKAPKTEAIVVNIPGEVIYDLRKKYGRRLFTKDVRYFLGETPINKQIYRTLKFPTNREFFWYYNNGISISCFDYVLDEKKGTVEVSRPQIINGCQTAESIYNYADKMGVHNLDSVGVLTRIIKTRDSTISQNITAGTNTQNPQSVRNLCANMESQTSLKQLFSDLKFPVFYETKDGEWESFPQFQKDRYVESGGAIRLIDNRDAAQAYIAFARDDELLNPVEARRMRSVVFDIADDYYTEVFPDEPRSPQEYLVPALFLLYVENRLKEIRKELDAHSPLTEEERESHELRMSIRYAKWFIMGIVGGLVCTHYKDKDFATIAKLLSSTVGDFEKPSELATYLIDFAIDVIEGYSDDQRSHDAEFDPALAFRQESAWKQLRGRALRKYRRAIEKGEPWVNLFPK